MNKLAVAQVLAALVVSTVLGALPACDGERASQSEDVSEASDAASSALVGLWQFVYTDEARGRHEARMLAETKDAAEIEAARRAAEIEAAQSRIELTEEGELFSWVQGELILQAAYRARRLSDDTVSLSMKDGGADHTAIVTLRGPDEIVIDDPRKGPLTFRRVSSR